MYDFCITPIYAGLLAIGGVAGYATAGSTKSLIMGVVGAALLGLLSWISMKYFEVCASCRASSSFLFLESCFSLVKCRPTIALYAHLSKASCASRRRVPNGQLRRELRVSCTRDMPKLERYMLTPSPIQLSIMGIHDHIQYIHLPHGRHNVKQRHVAKPQIFPAGVVLVISMGMLVFLAWCIFAGPVPKQKARQ